MKNKVIPYFLASLIFFSPSVFAINFFGKDDIIWKENANVYVKYAAQDSTGYGDNDHPVELSETDIDAIFRAMKMRDKESKTVFTDRQADILGKALAKGLRNAKPNQDIVFALDRKSIRPMGLTPRIYYLSGRVFYKDSRLNLIIGDYDLRRNIAYEAAYDPTNVGITRYYFHHGKRTVGSESFDGQIVQLEGVETMQINDALRDDWFLIDVGTASTIISQNAVAQENAERARPAYSTPAAAAAPPPPPPPAAAAPPAAAPPAAAPPATAPPATTAPAATAPAAAAAAPAAAAPAAAAQPTPPTAPHPVEQRLEVLKRLRDRDLITEDEYDKKRKQIIDEF